MTLKYIKEFENLNTDEYMVVEINSVDRRERKNEYSGEIQLIETNNIMYGEHNILARVIIPGATISYSATFDIFYDGIKKEYYTDYGYIFNILYRTKNYDDAIKNYDMFLNAKKYNL